MILIPKYLDELGSTLQKTSFMWQIRYSMKSCRLSNQNLQDNPGIARSLAVSMFVRPAQQMRQYWNRKLNDMVRCYPNDFLVNISCRKYMFDFESQVLQSFFELLLTSLCRWIQDKHDLQVKFKSCLDATSKLQQVEASQYELSQILIPHD